MGSGYLCSWTLPYFPVRTVCSLHQLLKDICDLKSSKNSGLEEINQPFSSGLVNPSLRNGGLIAGGNSS